MKLAMKSLLFYSFLAKIPALFAGDKILFGKTVEDKNKYPYFASAGGCGGALIAPDVVLTAAHCANAFLGYIYIGGLLGTNLYSVNGNTYTLKKRQDGERRTCIEWISDPEYIDNDDRLVHDYALCKLNKPVTSIEPIKLHDGSDALSNGQELLVMGHGKTESDSGSTYLLDTTVEYVDTYDHTEGSQMFADTFDEEGLIIGGTCTGDSGGPLVWRKDGIDTVVGVVSFGHKVTGEEKCLGSLPDGYARVSYRYDWIVETMWTLSDFPKAGPPGYCQDDPDWTFREQSEQSCQWFREDKQHTWRDPVKFCGKTANGTGPSNTDKTKVWAYCKRTCYELGNTYGCESIFWY